MKNTNAAFEWNRRAVLGASVALPVALLYGCGGGGNAANAPIAQEPVITTHQQMIDWYGAAKFGMFIHWGIYSDIGKGEWSLNNLPEFNNGMQTGLDAYNNYAKNFDSDPTAIPRIVKLAKDAGMRYIVLVTRHHDGFSLWNSKASDYASQYNVMNFGKKSDVLKTFADACAQHGIKLVLYYSLLDWTNPDYPVASSPPKQPHLSLYAKQVGDWPRYQSFMKNQLKELLTNYGQIAGIWFDGYWAQGDKSVWKIADIYKTINDAQPVTLIGNNQGIGSESILLPGEDFTIGERDTAGGDADTPGETVDTTQTGSSPAGTWGYASTATIQPPSWIFEKLITSISIGKNFVLNIGPRANGTVQSDITTGFAIVGSWMKTNAEAIYGTRAGVPTLESTWGTDINGKNYLYVFIRDPKLTTIDLPISVTKVQSAATLVGSTALKVSQHPLTSVITIDLNAATRVDGVPLVLKLNAT